VNTNRKPQPNTNSNSETETVAPSRSNWERLLQNLALSGVVFLLCIVVFEIVLRFCGYGSVEIYQPDPKLYWKLKPNQDCHTKVGHEPVHINSQGTRGSEFQIEKSPRTIRILSLGDSRTFGWGLSDEETYSRRLERLLQSHVGSGKKIEVINAGVNAWSYPQMLIYFRDFGLHYHPDFVILGDANLWTQFSENNSPEFVKSFMWRVRLKNFLRHFAIYQFVVEQELRQFYERERVKFIPVDPRQDALFKKEQQKDPDMLFRSSIDGVCQTAASNRIKTVLLFLPAEDTTSSDILKIKQKAHEKWGVPLVDVTSEVRPLGKALYLDADPVHFNARGNEIIANQLFKTITNSMTP